MTDQEIVAGSATPEQQRLVARGTELMQRTWPDVPLRAFDLPDDGAVLLVQQGRGGGSIFVAADGSVMFAASALSSPAALELFRSGKRTDEAEFTPSTEGGGGRR